MNRSLPEAVLIRGSRQPSFYGSVFDGELILSVRCTDVDDVVFIQRPRTVRSAVYCGGDGTRIVHKGFFSYEEEGRCQKEAHNEVKVFFIMACQEIRTTGSSEVNIFCKSGVIIRVLSFLNRII